MYISKDGEAQMGGGRIEGRALRLDRLGGRAPRLGGNFENFLVFSNLRIVEEGPPGVT